MIYDHNDFEILVAKSHYRQIEFIVHIHFYSN